MVNGTVNATKIFTTYSHDHDLDDDFQTLSSNGKFNLWTNGPAIIANASVNNVNSNRASNSLADIVSGDTTQFTTYGTGLEYNVTNSRYSLFSSILYNISEADDDIGESKGYTATINTQNGGSSRGLLWQLNASYIDRNNNGFTGRMHRVNGQVGLYTASGFSPFIRYYSEDSTGRVSSSRNTSSSSLGPGVRIKVTSHLDLDLSYNYTDDKQQGDDYVAVTINWQPSANTSLIADYDQRFFGESYSLRFNHKLKRLTNTVSYTEKIAVFERNNFQQVLLGSFFCPIESNINNDISSCLLASDTSINLDEYIPIQLFELELIEDNEFSLNKVLSWNTALNLARTTFGFTLSNSERTSLATDRRNDSLNASLTISRKLSGKSDLSLVGSFNNQEFNRNNLIGVNQKDYYRTVTAAYNREFGHSSSMKFSIQKLDRDSSRAGMTYNETRATINITKDF